MKLLSIAILIFSFEAGAALKGEDSRRTTPANQHESHHMGSTVRVNSSSSGNFVGTGILVKSSRILLTNWHVLYSRSTGRRKPNLAVQLNPNYNTQQIGINWSNHWCDEDYDVCVVELDQEVPQAGAVKVVDRVPESYLQNPSKFGEITVSGFSLEVFRSRDAYLGDSSTEATSIVPSSVMSEAGIKKVESCRARDFDELYQELLGDCDSRQGNSGSGATVSLNGMATLIGFVHNQIVGDIEDGAPYSPSENAVAIRPITEDISVEIQRVYERSKQ